MKPHLLVCTVALFFLPFIFRPITPVMAGESEQGPPIFRAGQPVIAVSTDDTTKQQEEEKQFREAREAYEREVDVEQRRAKFEHLMEEKKSKA